MITLQQILEKIPDDTDIEVLENEWVVSGTNESIQRMVTPQVLETECINIAPYYKDCTGIRLWVK